MIRVSSLAKLLAFAALLVATSGVAARADEIITVGEAYDLNDPLHGFCGTSDSGSTCMDNGVVTPFSAADIAAGFGFSVSPKTLSSPSWLIAILVPNTVAGYASETFTVSETAGSGNTAKTVTGVKVGTTWTSGDLATYLGLSSSPANSFGGFTAQADTGVTAFAVYVANLGLATLYKQSDASAPSQPILTLGGSPIVTGLEIAAFVTSNAVTCTTSGCPGGGQSIGTPASNVLQAQGTTSVPEPATLAMFGLGAALCGAGRRRLRRAV